MRRILLAFTVCLCSIQIFAQESLPNESTKERTKESTQLLSEELMGNWLSPKNNAWEYGFYRHSAMVDGSFWDYSSIQTKRKRTVLRLKKEGERLALVITPRGEDYIEVVNTAGTKAVLSRNPVENPDYAFYEEEGFQQPIINPANFRLSGFIEGYDPDKDDYKYVNVIYNHLLKGNQVVHLAQLDSLGRFSMDFSLMNPQEIMFEFGNKLVGLFAVPGSELMISVSKESSKLLFAGREGLLNTELNRYNPKLREILKFNINSQQIEKLNQHDYKTFRLGKMTEQLTNLKNYSAMHRNSRRFKEQMEAHIRYWAADDLMRYSWLHDMNGRETLSDEYMAFLEVIPMNNPLGLLTDNYSAFLNEYSMYETFTQSNAPITYSFPEVIARAKTDGAKIESEDEKKLLYYGNLYETDPAAAREFYETDSISLQNLMEKYGDAFADATGHLGIESRKLSLLKTVTNLHKGPGRDVLFGKIATDLMEQIRLPLNEEKLAFYREQISNPEIYKEIERTHMELSRKISGGLPSDATIISSLKAAQDSVLEALIAPYKGKVLYIDFWAPWCGPCMGEMPASKTLKKEMAGNDVVFLYLGVNCSEESWENTIKAEEIDGEHYLLSKDEYALLSSRFGISGIPRYMLIDKKGKVSDADAERPSSGQTLTNDIQALLE